MASPLTPRTVVPDRLQGALGWYRVAAYITGILLILLTVEIVAKYGYGSELEMNGAQGSWLLYLMELFKPSTCRP